MGHKQLGTEKVQEGAVGMLRKTTRKREWKTTLTKLALLIFVISYGSGSGLWAWDVLQARVAPRGTPTWCSTWGQELQVGGPSLLTR